MKKLFLFLSLLIINCGVLFAEDITITTYYPSPYGSYDSLQTNKLGVGVAAPATTGSINSPMWKVTQLYNMQAPAVSLPMTSGAFTTGGGTLLIFASGEGWAGSAKQIGMSIAVDGVIRGYAKTFTNELSSHKTFTTNALVVTGIAAGSSHTITLASWNTTNTDVNDFFTVTVLELPF